jgi:hypothetical protein
MKTSISAKYRIILKVEYLPSVWTTWKNVCILVGRAWCGGEILTAQVKIDAAATCSFISYILQDAY